MHFISFLFPSHLHSLWDRCYLDFCLRNKSIAWKSRVNLEFINTFVCYSYLWCIFLLSFHLFLFFIDSIQLSVWSLVCFSMVSIIISFPFVLFLFIPIIQFACSKCFHFINCYLFHLEKKTKREDKKRTKWKEEREKNKWKSQFISSHHFTHI